MKISVEDIQRCKDQFIYDNMLMSKKAVCALLDCSLRTVERMVEDGDLIVYERYPGRGVKFRAKDVNRYIESIQRFNNYDCGG